MDNDIKQTLKANVNDNLSIVSTVYKGPGTSTENFSTLASYVPSNANFTTGGASTLTCWDWWTHDYYPRVIRESYPIYIKERAEDKGKQAFEILKALQDKKLMKLDKVSDFIEAMDTLIKIL